MSSEDFSVAMLGGRGVGKTSVLTAMYHEFDRAVSTPGLQMQADPQTQLTLDGRLCQLMHVAQATTSIVDTASFTDATASPTEYKFELNHVAVDRSFELTFHDYPGGYLQDLKYQEWVRNTLENASVIVVALDAIALMALPDGDHEAVNLPTNIKNTLATVLRKRPDLRRLVMFVPMRGERWLRQNQGEEMLAAFRRRFAAALKVLSYYSKTVDVVFSPVQSLASVQFKCYSGSRPIFEKVCDQPYTPVDCDQILRHCVRHLLLRLESIAKAHLDSLRAQRSSEPWWKRLSKDVLENLGIPTSDRKEFAAFLNLSGKLQDSLAEFARDCKFDNPFVVLQGLESHRSKAVEVLIEQVFQGSALEQCVSSK